MLERSPAHKRMNAHSTQPGAAHKHCSRRTRSSALSCVGTTVVTLRCSANCAAASHKGLCGQGYCRGFN